MDISRPPDSAASGFARRLAGRGAMSAGFGVAIACVLWMLGNKHFGITLAYSLCIAVSCWALIEGGRASVSRLLRRRAEAGDGADAGAGTTGTLWAPTGGWPGWPWMATIVAVGALGGYLLGTAIANLLLGLDSPGLFAATPRGASHLVALGLVPAAAITWFFVARERLAEREARALRAERLAADQRLKLVESQLDPHMLFNTLANLRALIRLDPDRAQAMLDRLIAFLRASLAGSRASTHTLAEEQARLADYLALLQVRMGPRLVARFAPLDAATGRARIPAFLLQPLVENAVSHGLEPKVAGGSVDIDARRDGDTLVLRVADTGVGLAAARRRGSDGTGFGLAHVRERLQALHGDAASLTVAEAADGEGTVATVRLPFETGPDAGPVAGGASASVAGSGTFPMEGSGGRAVPAPGAEART